MHPPRDRRERERAATRALILDAAREMFVAHGVEATTMRAIAARIDYTPTAIYHHFKDKSALFQELCFLDFRTLAASFAELRSVADPLERVYRLGVKYMEFALRWPRHYQFMFMTVHPHPGPELEGAPERGNPEQDAYFFLRGSAEALIASGRLLPHLTDPAVVAQLLWAPLHGLVALRISLHEDPWIDWPDTRQTAGEICRTVLRGILRDRSLVDSLPALDRALDVDPSAEGTPA